MIYEVYHSYYCGKTDPYEKHVIRKIGDGNIDDYEDFDCCGSVEGQSYSYYGSLSQALKCCTPGTTSVQNLDEKEKAHVVAFFNRFYGTRLTPKDLQVAGEEPDNKRRYKISFNEKLIAYNIESLEEAEDFKKGFIYRTNGYTTEELELMTVEEYEAGSESDPAKRAEALLTQG